MNKFSAKYFLALYAIILCCLAPLRPMWLDEVLQLADTYHNTLGNTVDRVAHNPGGVPLTYIVQNLFVNVTDYPFYAARLLTILWALAAMASFIWLARILRTNWLTAALCYAILPISLRYALEVRQYGPALAFNIFATALLICLDARPNCLAAALYGAVMTLGLYSHPYLGFVVLAHMIWASRRPSAKYVLPASAVAVLLFLPWYLFVRSFWSQAVSRGGYESTFTWKTPLMIPHELSGGGYFLTFALLGLAFFGYRRSLISRSSKQLLLLCILVPLPLVMLANTLFRYFFAIRQLIFIIPPLCIFAAEGFCALPSKAARTLVSIALILLALVYDFRWFHLP